MAGLLNTFFGPLGKEACVYFLFLTGFFLFLLIIALLGDVYYVFKHYKNIKITDITQGVLIFFNLFLAYFVNRLLYSMCSKSLQ